MRPRPQQQVSADCPRFAKPEGTDARQLSNQPGSEESSQHVKRGRPRMQPPSLLSSLSNLRSCGSRSGSWSRCAACCCACVSTCRCACLGTCCRASRCAAFLSRTMTTTRAMTRCTRHRLRRDCFRAIRSRLRIAGCLLYAAGSRLSLGRSLRGFLTRRFSASRCSVGAVRRVDGALRRVRLVRGASREQRKGQHSPGKSNQF